MNTSEIIFEVTEAVEGGYDAKALGHSIFTQGESWEDLEELLRDAVCCHFEDTGVARAIRLRRGPARNSGEQVILACLDT